MIGTISNVITISPVTETLRKWCEKNLRLPNPEYAKKVRMNLWVGKTPKTIDLYEVRGDEIV